MHTNELLKDNQCGFTPHKCTTDAAMEAKKFIEPELEKRKVIIMVSLDVEKAFDASRWPSILKGLKDSGCPRNLYHLSKVYFRDRYTVMSSNISIEKRITKGCPQGPS